MLTRRHTHRSKVVIGKVQRGAGQLGEIHGVFCHFDIGATGRGALGVVEHGRGVRIEVCEWQNVGTGQVGCGPVKRLDELSR